MAVDWDAELLAPVMAVFGEGSEHDPLTWPTYTPRGLFSFQLPGAVFDEYYAEIVVAPDEDPGVTSRRPVLGVRASLFARPPAQNDTVFIPSKAKSYIVRDQQPDGHGHIKLLLMELA